MKGMLSVKKLTDEVCASFGKITDPHHGSISLRDCLMSGYAMFSLKYPSLLQFDQDCREGITGHNLKTVYQIQQAPSDTQMRERLDKVSPRQLRPAFKRILAQCQRSKHLELFKYMDGRYLMPIDGTGYFYSKSVHCEHCCEKHHRNGSVSYYHQMLVASIVHPSQKVVLPFAPEAIMKSDGSSKNDCERNATKRFLEDLKREHPHLKLIITGDGLFSNGPLIKHLLSDGHRYILVAKEKDHKALFEDFCSLPQSSHKITEGDITHGFHWINGLPLNDSHPDLLVNVLEYTEHHANGKKQRWVWVTDFQLNQKNVFRIMEGGRARHKIENETFNTLKNQGYHFEHNFGHGKQHLGTVFGNLMLLAFFVDQLSQLGCKVFNKALKRLLSKRRLWERLRMHFFGFFISSIEDLWTSLAFGHKTSLTPNTS